MSYTINVTEMSNNLNISYFRTSINKRLIVSRCLKEILNWQCIHFLQVTDLRIYLIFF